MSRPRSHSKLLQPHRSKRRRPPGKFLHARQPRPPVGEGELPNALKSPSPVWKRPLGRSIHRVLRMRTLAWMWGTRRSSLLHRSESAGVPR